MNMHMQMLTVIPETTFSLLVITLHIAPFIILLLQSNLVQNPSALWYALHGDAKTTPHPETRFLANY